MIFFVYKTAVFYGFWFPILAIKSLFSKKKKVHFLNLLIKHIVLSMCQALC